MLLLLLIGVLAGAAIAWPEVRARSPHRAAWLPTAAGLVGLTIVWLASRNAPISLTLSTWTAGAPFGGNLLLHADSLSLLLVGSALLLLTASSLAESHPSAGRRTVGFDIALWLTAATVTFLVAGNLITLALAWVLLEMPIMAALRLQLPTVPQSVRIQALSVNYLGTLLVFVAGIASLGQRVTLANQPWTLGAMGGLPATLLTVAAWIRLGAYPFFRNVPDLGVGPIATIVRFMPMTAGAYLAARATSLAGDPSVEGVAWALLFGLVTLAAALMAWLAATRHDALRWLAVYGASMLLLGLTSGESETAALVVLGGVSLILSLGALFLAVPLLENPPGGRARLWLQLMLALALLSLWGLPVTSGFLYRWGVFQANLETSTLLATLLTLVASTVAAAPLWLLARDVWGLRRAPAIPPAPTLRSLQIAVTGLALPLLVIGLAPGVIAPALEGAGGPGGLSYVLDGVRGTPASLAPVVASLILIAWLAGLGLSIVRAQLPPDSRTVRDLRAALSLDWLYRRRWRPVRRGLGMLQTLTTLGAGERYVGMLIVFAFIIVLALLAQTQP